MCKEIQEKFQSLSKEEFLDYLKKSNCTDYDFFEVSADRIVSITEYGYMSDGSATDNPEETSRIVDCRYPEFSLDSLTGDDDEDSFMVDVILEEARQYIDDVTDDEFYERIYEIFSEGAVEGSYYDKDLQTGKYITL